MAVTVKIPPQLSAATGGDRAPKADGSTVGEVLSKVYEQHSELKERIADEDGTIRRFVNVFLDGEDIRFLQDLDTEVKDGAELTILPAVAGG